MARDPLESFTPQVREWFARSFAGPTEAQTQAWPAIAGGEHVLVSAPTGSGKTLAAFLWGLDRLVAEPSSGRTRIVYVSPLKALSYDVEKNLRAPLKGIGGERDQRRAAYGRHSAEGAPGDAAHAARRAHHNARVALPDAHVAGARDLRRRRGRDRRRDPRRRPHEARRAPGAHARAPRPRRRRAGAADRAVGHPAPAGGGRPFPRRHAGATARSSTPACASRSTSRSTCPSTTCASRTTAPT